MNHSKRGRAPLLWTLPLVALLWLLNARPAAAQDSPFDQPANRPVVVRVYYATPEKLQSLTSEEDVWEVNARGGYALVLTTAGHADDLRAAGTRVEQDLIRTEEVRSLPARMRNKSGPGISGFPCYRTVSETEARLLELAQTYPTFVTLTDIGDSWERTELGEEAGHDLWALSLTNSAMPGEKFRFSVMGAIHARELATPETALRFAEELLADYGKDADATWLLDYGELHILPIANPDGRIKAESGTLWRKNTNSSDVCSGYPTGFSHSGVDLNRNSSFLWNQCNGFGCSSDQFCSQVYRGRSAASEPETQAIQGWLTSLYADQRGDGLADPAPDDTSGLFFTLHTYGQLVLYPWGWTDSPPPNAAQLRRLGEHLSHFTGYDACQIGAPGCLYPVDGSTDDWLYGERGVASYTFEMGYEFFQSCSYFEETLYPDMKEALLYAFKAARLPYQLPAGPEVITATVSMTSAVAGELVTLRADLGELGKYDQPVSVDDGEVLRATPALTVTGHITTARWWINVPSWEGDAGYPMVPLDGVFDSMEEVAIVTLDTAGWSPGRYTLFVEAQNAAGAWGVPSAVFLEVTPAPEVGPPYLRYLPVVAGVAQPLLSEASP